MTVQGILTSKLTRAVLLTALGLMCILTLRNAITGYGKEKYEAGRQSVLLTIAQATNDANAEGIKQLSTDLKGLKEALRIQAERDAIAAKEAALRQQKLLNTLETLSNVPEPDCIRVSRDTWRLLNSPACDYNTRHGFSTPGCAQGGVAF